MNSEIFYILRSKMYDNNNTKTKETVERSHETLLIHFSQKWKDCSYFYFELHLFKLESMTACVY